MASTLYKKCFSKIRFCFILVKKLEISCSLDYTILFKFHWQVVQAFCKEFMDRLYTSSVRVNNGSTDVLNDNLLKNDFPIGHFMLPLLMLTLSLKSLHTLFGMYLDHMLVEFDQNRTVRTIQNFELFDKKWLTIFDKVLTPFWKTFLGLNQLSDSKLSI